MKKESKSNAAEDESLFRMRSARFTFYSRRGERTLRCCGVDVAFNYYAAPCQLTGTLTVWWLQWGLAVHEWERRLFDVCRAL